MKTIVFDFDGVIHKYRNGWKDGSIYDEPNVVVVNAIKKIMTEGKYAIAIVSTRDPEQIHSWIQKNKLFPSHVLREDEIFFNSCNEVGITNRKIPAVLYVDDRAFRFDPTICINSGHLINTLSQYAEM